MSFNCTRKTSVEVHQLSIGGKEDPARLVFKTAPGNAINVSVIDLGNRFRMIVNEVEVVKCPDMPKSSGCQCFVETNA